MACRQPGTIAAQHFASNGGWDVLVRTNPSAGRAHVGVVNRTHVGGVSCTRVGGVGRTRVGGGGRTRVGVMIRTHVGGVNRDRADLLRVATGHIDDLRVDFNRFAASLLPAAMALAADGHGQLVVAATRVARPAEHVPRHEQQCRIFIERVI